MNDEIDQKDQRTETPMIHGSSSLNGVVLVDHVVTNHIFERKTPRLPKVYDRAQSEKDRRSHFTPHRERDLPSCFGEGVQLYRKERGTNLG